MRQMELLDISQMVNLDLDRVLVSLTISAEWSTFSRGVAICKVRKSVSKFRGEIWMGITKNS